MPTIRDVAARANVSVATVSRVLNRSGYADSDTRVRVLQAAADLSYQPNINWSRLKAKSSQTVLFLLGNRENFNPFHMRLLSSSERLLQLRGYDLVFSRHEYPGDVPAGEIPLPRLLEQSGAIDGAILAGVHYPNLLQVLENRDIPYTLLANDFAGTPAQLANNCVFFDDASGIAEATTYLINLGHRRIAFVGNLALSWFRRRYEAYRETMERHGLTPMSVSESWPLSGPEYGQRAAAQLLQTAEPPTAILGGNDELAAGVWKELTRRGISIPREMSLIGCGDRVEFAILEPELTSISVFVDQIGERLTNMLLTRLDAPAVAQPSETQPSKLIERASCAPPPSL